MASETLLVFNSVMSVTSIVAESTVSEKVSDRKPLSISREYRMSRGAVVSGMKLSASLAEDGRTAITSFPAKSVTVVEVRLTYELASLVAISLRSFRVFRSESAIVIDKVNPSAEVWTLEGASARLNDDVAAPVRRVIWS